MRFMSEPGFGPLIFLPVSKPSSHACFADASAPLLPVRLIFLGSKNGGVSKAQPPLRFAAESRVTTSRLYFGPPRASMRVTMA